MEQSLANLNPSIHMADPLVFREPNGSVKPHLATAWSYPDEKTLRFKVRKDVKFHNGDVMTTEDVAFTYNLLLDPKTDSRHTPALRAIGEVKAVDAETVDFVLKEPDATLLGRLSILPVMPKKYFESVGGVDPFGQKPVGTGPFKFVEWVKGQHVKMEANPDYFLGPPKIKTIVYRQISEDNTRITELLTGNADLVNNVPPSLAPKIKSDAKTELQTVRGLRNVYLKINTKKAPFTDLKVRQALEPRHRRQADHRDGPGRQRRRHARRLRGPRRLGLLQGHRQRGVPVRPEQGEGAPRRGRRQARPDQHPLGEGPPAQRRRGRPGHRRACSRTSASRLKSNLLDFTVVNDEWNRKYREELDLHLWSNANNTADADYNYSTNFYTKNTGLYWGTPEMDDMVVKARTTLDTDLAREAVPGHRQEAPGRGGRRAALRPGGLVRGQQAAEGVPGPRRRADVPLRRLRGGLVEPGEKARRGPRPGSGFRSSILHPERGGHARKRAPLVDVRIPDARPIPRAAPPPW